MKYSDRILKTVDMIVPGHCMADIGCDHGYMSILAAQKSLFAKIYACDVNEGPLSRAKENIRTFGCSSVITPVLSDGLKNVPDDATCAVICGMGGLLIKKILADAKNRMDAFSQLVLGPHSETEDLRSYLIRETAFDIYRETAVFDSGKHYILMDVRPGKTAGKSRYYSTESDLKFGTVRNQTDLVSYAGHLDYLLDRDSKALELCARGNNPRSVERAEELKAEITLLTKRINELKENT